MIATRLAPPQDDAAEVVCRSCRLVQEPATRCAACAAIDLLPLARVGELATTRWALALELGDPPRSALGTVVAVLRTLAFVALAALPGREWLSRRRRLAPVAPRALPPATAGKTGVARTHGPPVRAAIAGRDALAVSTSVTAARDGRVYFRRAAATTLWLDGDDGERVLVCGEIWVDAPATSSPSALARRTSAEMLALVGVDGPLPIDEPLVIDEWAIYPGQRVAASGELRRELHAGAAYRDHVGLVLRGRPGAPVHLRAL
jgi:hypothetical protein